MRAKTAGIFLCPWILKSARCRRDLHTANENQHIKIKVWEGISSRHDDHGAFTSPRRNREVRIRLRLVDPRAYQPFSTANLPVLQDTLRAAPFIRRGLFRCNLRRSSALPRCE
jgi:hypothetical protein